MPTPFICLTSIPSLDDVRHAAVSPSHRWLCGVYKQHLYFKNIEAGQGAELPDDRLADYVVTGYARHAAYHHYSMQWIDVDGRDVCVVSYAACTAVLLVYMPITYSQELPVMYGTMKVTQRDSLALNFVCDSVQGNLRIYSCYH